MRNCGFIVVEDVCSDSEFIEKEKGYWDVFRWIS